MSPCVVIAMVTVLGWWLPVRNVTEKSLAHFLWRRDGDVESLTGHHCLHCVSPQLVQLGGQQLGRPERGREVRLVSSGLTLLTCYEHS